MWCRGFIFKYLGEIYDYLCSFLVSHLESSFGILWSSLMVYLGILVPWTHPFSILSPESHLSAGNFPILCAQACYILLLCRC